MASGATIVAAYATASVTVTGSSGTGAGLAGASAGTIRTSYSTGEATDDDAWHFGDAYSHPVLKFAGANTARQVSLLPGNAPTFSGAVSNATVDNGQPIAPITVPAATGGDGGSYTYGASGLPPGLVFDADGSGACETARTICGTPTEDGAFTVIAAAHDTDDDHRIVANLFNHTALECGRV